ncbi:MAG: hypothetical protein IPN03_21030 [Holophagales bacterium]|nr:hypothetical protein [Holophagales bacterium]
MTTTIWVLLALAVAGGLLYVFKHRTKRESDRKAHAEKKATTARNDAQAIQRTLDGRR